MLRALKIGQIVVIKILRLLIRNQPGLGLHALGLDDRGYQGGAYTPITADQALVNPMLDQQLFFNEAIQYAATLSRCKGLAAIRHHRRQGAGIIFLPDIAIINTRHCPLGQGIRLRCQEAVHGQCQPQQHASEQQIY